MNEQIKKRRRGAKVSPVSWNTSTKAQAEMESSVEVAQTMG